MGTCSYAWKEWNSEKSRIVEKRCQKETWEGSDEFCIFHDPSPDKDVDLFKEKLEEQMKSETERHDFAGYSFPINWDFSGVEFEINADFREATFHDANFREATFHDANFQRVTFQKDADFSGATLQNADFNEVTFQGTADFREATFHDANFREATFHDANFQRVTFQKDADFSGATLQNADFNEVTFQGTADFHGAAFESIYFGRATFQGNTYFHGAAFEKADFYGAAFKKDSYFHEAVFENAYFHKTIFQSADLNGVYIEKNLEFLPYKIKRLNLQNTKFFFRGIITADLVKAKFYRADLENIIFIDCIWPRKIYEELNRKDEGLSFRELETIYRSLKRNMQRHGDYSQAGNFYYREMEMRRKGTETKKKRLWLEIYRSLAGYGEKPERIVSTSFLAVLMFALLYWISECLQYSTENPAPLQQFLEAIYSSFIIFIVAGIGNIYPINNLGRVLIICEAVTGVFLIVLFVATFFRKMIR